MSDKTGKEAPAGGFGFQDILDRFYDFVEKMGSRRKVYGIVWGVIAVALAVAASLPLPEQLGFLVPIVGIPAGLILFGIGLSVVWFTKLNDMALFNVKDIFPQRKRVVPTLFGIGAVIAILIVTNSFLPKGVGGAIMVASALTAFNIIRRTPYENELARKGLIDPREEVEEEYDEYEDEEIISNNTDDILEEQTFLTDERGQEYRGRL